MIREFFSLVCPLGFFRLHFGGGGGSSSSHSDTNNIDKRVAVQGGAGVSGDSNTVTVTTADPAIVSRALDSVDVASATAEQGYSKLLDVTQTLFNQSQGLIGQTQKSVADAYQQAQAEKSGALDNKTILILGVVVAGAVAAVAIWGRK